MISFFGFSASAPFGFRKNQGWADAVGNRLQLSSGNGQFALAPNGIEGILHRASCLRQNLIRLPRDIRDVIQDQTTNP